MNLKLLYNQIEGAMTAKYYYEVYWCGSHEPPDSTLLLGKGYTWTTHPYFNNINVDLPDHYTNNTGNYRQSAYIELIVYKSELCSCNEFEAACECFYHFCCRSRL